YAAGEPLEAVDDFRNPPARVELDEQMHVIRHDLQGMYCHFKLTGFLMQQGFKAHRNLIGKHWPTVFGTPNNMQLKTKYGSSIFSVSAHKNIIRVSDSYHNYDCREQIKCPGL